MTIKLNELYTKRIRYNKNYLTSQFSRRHSESKKINF
jgi:hypothetical protein